MERKTRVFDLQKMGFNTKRGTELEVEVFEGGAEWRWNKKQDEVLITARQLPVAKIEEKVGLENMDDEAYFGPLSTLDLAYYRWLAVEGCAGCVLYKSRKCTGLNGSKAILQISEDADCAEVHDTMEMARCNPEQVR
jgi:hypothetical protein